MVEVVWTVRAKDQLKRNIRFISEEQGDYYARIVLDAILSDTAKLAFAPDIGTKEPLLAHKKSTYRFLVVWSFKIIYRRSVKRVIISRVFHSSRSPDKLKGV